MEDIALKTTLAADVHTYGLEGKVFEETTGKVDLIIVACPMPDGKAFLAVGPVLSYYEFKQPMNDRLTDETRRELHDSHDRPNRPEWYVPLTRWYIPQKYADGTTLRQGYALKQDLSEHYRSIHKTKQSCFSVLLRSILSTSFSIKKQFTSNSTSKSNSQLFHNPTLQCAKHVKKYFFSCANSLPTAT
jgi:hypothetical protein